MMADGDEDGNEDPPVFINLTGEPRIHMTCVMWGLTRRELQSKRIMMGHRIRTAIADPGIAQATNQNTLLHSSLPIHRKAAVYLSKSSCQRAGL